MDDLNILLSTCSRKNPTLVSPGHLLQRVLARRPSSLPAYQPQHWISGLLVSVLAPTACGVDPSREMRRWSSTTRNNNGESVGAWLIQLPKQCERPRRAWWQVGEDFCDLETLRRTNWLKSHFNETFHLHLCVKVLQTS